MPKTSLAGVAAGLANPANVSITGGTIAGSSITNAAHGLPVVLAKGGIPLIGLSTGSVAAGGAISGITALPSVYPDAFCWFPANILAASIAAGWYYCTFSSATAGTAFLNTYTSGIPTIPASPTAVTAGQGAFTGDTGEEFGHTITIPANAMGANGMVRVSVGAEQTNNANVKTLRLHWSGSGGSIFLTQPGASQAVIGFIGQVSNTSATNKNKSITLAQVNAAMTLFGLVGTVDTTASTTLVLSIQRAVATDNFVILPPTFELFSDGT